MPGGTIKGGVYYNRKRRAAAKQHIARQLEAKYGPLTAAEREKLSAFITRKMTIAFVNKIQGKTEAEMIDPEIFGKAAADALMPVIERELKGLRKK